MTKFSRNITPFVESEIQQAAQANTIEQEFHHLENAHVLGQSSTFHHVKVHFLMLKWGWREKDMKEICGQIFRIIGAATKTAVGLVPSGNTGGANISPFKTLPVDNELSDIIQKAYGKS